MKLVIVESPAKCSKISNFLGKDYIVKASYGHFRDLSKNDLGIDVDNNFKPNYVLSNDKNYVINDLKNAMKKCDDLYLAADNDREGEAIAFHLDYLLNKGSLKSKRVLFNEITKTALTNAISNPTKINIHLFYAQQARRIIDRLVGFTLTPILWKNIQANYSKGKTLSAGRVQSVVNKLIYEKELTISQFQKSPYFNIKGNLDFKNNIIPIKSTTKINSYKKTMELLELSKQQPFIVKDIKKKESLENPKPPFITSSLQTESYNKLGMGSKQCMLVAQKLYENGHITYMRTDSTALSEEAHTHIKDLIHINYGDEYYRRKNYSNKKNAQEAHECCRPTHIEHLSKDIAGTNDEIRLYDLIWKRTIASQMKPIKKDVLDVKINLEKHIFLSTYDKIKFLGFSILYQKNNPDDDANNQLTSFNDSTLHLLKIGDQLNLVDLIANEKYTTPEPRYNDGSLVKKLEEMGIGRPSTYSNMINGVLDKHLVTKTKIDGEDLDLVTLTIKKNQSIQETKETIKYGKDNDKLITTEMGKIVHNFLDKWFHTIINYTFTANLEQKLDLVADGTEDWVNVVRNIYKLLVTNEKYQQPMSNISKQKVSKVLGLNPGNNKEISVHLGQYGLYLKESSNDPAIKDRNVSLKEERIDNINLEKAIQLLSYPKELGLYKKKSVQLHQGPYGIYIKYDNQNYSIKDIEEPDLTMDNVIDIIKQESNKPTPEVKSFKNGKLVIMIGKYGPYIKYKDSNFPIRLDKSIKGDDIIRQHLEKFTLDDCKDIIQNKEKTKKK